MGLAAVGGSLVSGVLGARSSDRAADAQVESNQAAIEEQRRQFDTILGLTQPQRDVGNQALNVLASAFIPGFQGLSVSDPSATPPNVLAQSPTLNFPFGFEVPNPNFQPATQPTSTTNQLAPINSAALSDIFRNIPGAQFQVDEAVNAIENSAAAAGGTLSGNTLRAISDRSGNIAANTVFNGLGQLAGVGQIGTNNAVNAATNVGNNVSNLLNANGVARASGINDSAASINNAVQGGIMNYLLLGGFI